MMENINTRLPASHKDKSKMPNHNLFRPGTGLGGNILRDALSTVLLATAPGTAGSKKSRQSITTDPRTRLRVRRASCHIAEIALQVFAPFRLPTSGRRGRWQQINQSGNELPER
jgi:hypothetical protein